MITWGLRGTRGGLNPQSLLTPSCLDFLLPLASHNIENNFIELLDLMCSS